MSFDFNLEAAIDKIAELEDAIATPLPGVVTAYGYNENPAEITDVSKLPAVVHVPLGPRTEGPGFQPGNIGYGTYNLTFEIYSRLLIIEAVLDQYPADEAAASLFWQPVVETFFNVTNHVALCQASGAHTYACTFPEQAYKPRPWPPVPNAPRFYWSLQYVHRFTFTGG